MEPTRRFDDREIALIFERADHLQESTQGNPGNEGLTLAHPVLEPTERGHRLRLSTRKGSARSLVGVGVGYLAGSGLFALLGVTGAMASNAATPAAAIFAACGAAFLAATALSLPRWARTRASQMESIATQAGRLIAPAETGRAVRSNA